MDLIFRGMVFVLLDIQLELGERTIGLIPDWLGWWWVAQGAGLLEDRGFGKLRWPALGLAVYSAVLYAMELMELTVSQEAVLWALGLIAAVGTVIMTRLTAARICRLEQKLNRDLRGRKLENLWVYLAVLRILGALLSWMPLVGTGCAAAVFLMGICWLAALNDSRKRFREI